MCESVLTQVTIMSQSSHPNERIIQPLTYILAITVMADNAKNTAEIASMSYDLSSWRVGVPLAAVMIANLAPNDA